MIGQFPAKKLQKSCKRDFTAALSLLFLGHAWYTDYWQMSIAEIPAFLNNIFSQYFFTILFRNIFYNFFGGIFSNVFSKYLYSEIPDNVKKSENKK